MLIKLAKSRDGKCRAPVREALGGGQKLLSDSQTLCPDSKAYMTSFH